MDSETKKKCLLILPRAIFPMVSGYSNKNYNLILRLSRDYNLYVIVLSEGRLSGQEQEFYDENCFFWRKYSFSRTAGFILAVSGFLRGEPLQIGFYYRRKIQKELTALCADMDIVIAGLIRTAKYLKEVTGSQIKVLDMVDSIGLNYINSYKNTSNIFWRFLYKVEGERLARFERDCVKVFDQTFFVSWAECECFSEWGQTAWLPHGVKSELFTYEKRDEQYENSVVFIGKMNYRPNIEAVKWYVKNVHARIGDKIPLVIAGAFPPAEIKKLAEEGRNIIVTGYCEDPYLFLKSCLAVIAPMRTGGGIQNKVLEGMAVGNVTILSSLAARPIAGAVDRRHFLIADSPEEFADCIEFVRDRKSEAEEIRRNAREFARQNYSWENYYRGYYDNLEGQSIR